MISVCANIDCTIHLSRKLPALMGNPSCVGTQDNLLLLFRKWLETDFQHLVRRRRLAVTSKTGQAAATSAANGILTVLKAWNGASDPDVLSSGVACPG